LLNPGYQDTNNRRAERSLSNIDIPQRLALSYGWELPFGPGKPLLNSRGAVISNLTGGRQINGITIIQGGVLLGLTTSANQTNSFGGSRPNNSGHSAKLSGLIEARLNKFTSIHPCSRSRLRSPLGIRQEPCPMCERPALSTLTSP
jgi:hypothetical protein